MLSEESLSSSGFLHTRHGMLIMKLSVFANFLVHLSLVTSVDSHHFYFLPLSLFVEDFFSGGVILQTKVSNWGGFCWGTKVAGWREEVQSIELETSRTSLRSLIPHNPG